MKKSSGKCNLCGGTFAKAAMARHVSSCRDPKAAENSRKVESLHVLVQGGYRNVYWLHLAIPRELTLEKLDTFLRNTWLECCGHLSGFTIGDQLYTVAPMEDVFGHKNRSMNVPAGKVLRVGAMFSYEYDYGSTTELSLEVLGMLETSGNSNEVQLLARNEPPQILCDECGANATQVCSQCLWQGGGWCCDDCAETHSCGEEMLLPVVNSPRVGVCAYTG